MTQHLATLAERTEALTLTYPDGRQVRVQFLGRNPSRRDEWLIGLSAPADLKILRTEMLARDEDTV